MDIKKKMSCFRCNRYNPANVGISLRNQPIVETIFCSLRSIAIKTLTSLSGLKNMCFFIENPVSNRFNIKLWTSHNPYHLSFAYVKKLHLGPNEGKCC